jgi:hypothetical protein
LINVLVVLAVLIVLRYEKAKGADVARKLHAERGAKGVITLIDDYPEDETFW